MARCSDGPKDDQDLPESEAYLTRLKGLVLEQISTANTAGPFATASSFQNFVLPGILVDGVGTIQIPLSLQDAQSLIRESRHALFENGSQSKIDGTASKTWEIEAHRVSFSNKAWHSWLEGVIKLAAKNLGVAGNPKNMRAELYNMLLYEKGAMFKPHQKYVDDTALLR